MRNGSFVGKLLAGVGIFFIFMIGAAILGAVYDPAGISGENLPNTSSPVSASNTTDSVETVSTGKANALGSAETYIQVQSFSQEGLREQLQYEDYTDNQIDYALNNVDVNWKEEAAEKAETYLQTQDFSRSGLEQQLQYDGFNDEQTTYALTKVYGPAPEGEDTEKSADQGTDSYQTGEDTDESREEEVSLGKENALGKAETYLQTQSFSREGLRQQLGFEDFTEDQIDYALENIQVSWKEQAVGKAETYLSTQDFSRQGLIEQLTFDGFTEEQAEYAADEVGY